MLAAWGLLAFLKAADTRQNASFAVKKKTALGELPPDPLYELTDENIPVKKNRGLFRKKKTPEENEREIEEFFSKFENSGEESLPYLDSSPPGGSRKRRRSRKSTIFSACLTNRRPTAHRRIEAKRDLRILSLRRITVRTADLRTRTNPART